MSARHALAALALSIALTACTTLAPNADSVKLTRSADAVAGCRLVGPVETLYSGVNTERDLKNKAVGMGADAVFITQLIGLEAQGIAYRCRS